MFVFSGFFGFCWWMVLFFFGLRRRVVFCGWDNSLVKVNEQSSDCTTVLRFWLPVPGLRRQDMQIFNFFGQGARQILT